MRILVAGSAGFIGSELTLKLLERGQTLLVLIIITIIMTRPLKKQDFARQISHPDYTHIRMDIADESALKAVFSEHALKKL